MRQNIINIQKITKETWHKAKNVKHKLLNWHVGQINDEL
jgi:hypothetical protein